MERWDGVRWRRLTGAGSLGFGLPLGNPVLAASSARSAWIFPAVTEFSGTYNTAERWNGRSWRVIRFPVKLAVDAAVALSQRNVWAFGQVSRGAKSVPYATRFDGRRWRRAQVPAAPVAASTSPAGGLWAVGPTIRTAARPLARQALVALHWTGRAWRVIPAPKIAAAGSADYSLRRGFVASARPRELWWAYQVGAASPAVTRLLRWNGSRWSAIGLPRAVAGIAALAQDGRGGVWLVGDTVSGRNSGQSWFHFAGGRWTRQRVPSPRGFGSTLFDMTWIPGTTSQLAVGEADKNTGAKSVAVIAAYGTR